MANRQLLRDLVKTWWQERLMAECQLGRLDVFITGYDYIGENKWKIWVSNYALFADFSMWSNRSYNAGSFGAAFHSIVEGIAPCRRRVCLYTETGTGHIIKNRKGLNFGPLEVHTFEPGDVIRMPEYDMVKSINGGLPERNSKQGDVTRQEIPISIFKIVHALPDKTGYFHARWDDIIEQWELIGKGLKDQSW